MLGMPASHFFAEAPEALGIDPGKLRELLERIEREVREGLLPSAQIAIARHGKLVAMRTVGRATCGGCEQEATNDTLYVVFSCTKAIVSAAGWLLIQEGKLDPDERVADVIPEFGTNGKEVVRVDQLFTHTSGFPQAPYPQPEWLDREKRLERFARWRLNWEPGSRFEYHPTSSMWVICELIERRSGLGYREFVRERLAGPLGLDDLWVGLPRERHGRLADIVYTGEEPSDEELERLGFRRPPETEVNETTVQNFNSAHVREAGVPGGGGVMTAGDLALFYQALLSGRSSDGTQIWRPETLEMALRVRCTLPDPLWGRPSNRALGVVVAGGKERTLLGFGHTGSERTFGHGGAGGQIGWADPESGLSLGYCTNGFDRHPVRMGRRVVGISSRAAALLAG
jgi:CubicO group peptidase (beta-lactamase class C family)